MQMAHADTLNMYDIIPDTLPVFAEHEVQYRVLGGTATTAVIEANAFLPNDKKIAAPPEIHIPNIRDNGTVRDIDFLVMTTDPDKIAAIHKDVKEAAGKNAVVSVFGIPRHEEMMARSKWDGRLKDFTSERTIDADGNMYYLCHPIVQQVRTASYDQWEVQIEGGRNFTTLSPVALQAAYRIRSLGGERPRDHKKTMDMEVSMMHKWPEHEEYAQAMVSEWYDFRDAMQKMGFTDGGLDAFMLALRRPLIRFLDAQDWAVEISQGGGFLGEKIQPILGRFMREAESEEEKPEKRISPIEQKYIDTAQRISAMTGGIVTPGNVLSTMSLIITSHGITHMDDLSGVAEIAVGEGLDLVDGREARRTGTASKLGAALDAGFDKVKMALSLYTAARKGILPPVIAAEIAAQNLANTGLSLYGESQGMDMSPNIEGKHTRFIQISSMATFMIANYLDARGDTRSRTAATALRAIGWGGFAYQLKTGFEATKGLADTARGKTIQQIVEDDNADTGYREDPAERLFPYAA